MDDKKDLREFTEKVAELHKWCSNHQNSIISFYRDMPYDSTRTLLIEAIRATWTDMDLHDARRIYDIYVDCGESIAYCVNAWKQEKRREAEEVDIYGQDT